MQKPYEKKFSWQPLFKNGFGKLIGTKLNTCRSEHMHDQEREVYIHYTLNVAGVNLEFHATLFKVQKVSLS